MHLRGSPLRFNIEEAKKRRVLPKGVKANWHTCHGLWMSADIQNRILAHKICDNTLAFAKEGDAVRGHRSDPPRAGVRAG